MLLGNSEGQTLDELSEKRLIQKEDLARLFIKLADKILPGN